jgi:AcrR family transcriptional regulator
MEDPRIIKTRQALFRALACLLKEKEFERITVSDIIREAHVTRKTFYNHYQDKIDMVQEYQTMLSKEILALQAAHDAFDYDYFVDLLTLLGRKDALLSGLMSSHGSVAIQEIMKGTMAEYCLSRLGGREEDAALLKYQSIMMANAIFGIIQYWLTARPQLSPQETAGIICRLRFPTA